jgi:hypothetical protein
MRLQPCQKKVNGVFNEVEALQIESLTSYKAFKNTICNW